MKSLFVNVSLMDLVKIPASSIRSKADELGGLLGLLLKKINVRMVITAPIIACAMRLIITLCLKVSPSSSSVIKNTGNILPGHGGLLDRIDGIIFAVPFSYIILSYTIC